MRPIDDDLRVVIRHPHLVSLVHHRDGTYTVEINDGRTGFVMSGTFAKVFTMAADYVRATEEK